MKKLLVIIIVIIILFSGCDLFITDNSAEIVITNRYGPEDYTVIYDDDRYYVASGLYSSVTIDVEWAGSSDKYAVVRVYDGYISSSSSGRSVGSVYTYLKDGDT